MTDEQHEPPEDFTLEGEQSRQHQAPGIYAREAEPDGVGGHEPGFDGSTADDDEIDDPDAPSVEDI